MPAAKFPDISVIVPVFNTEEFLAECLDSILQQPGVDLEVIIVNDGSTDGSVDIIKKYMSQDERIKYFYQSNQGLSVARNTGLKLATGNYVLFVDSDDWLLPNSLADYIELARRKDVDVVVGKVGVYYPNGTAALWNHDAELHQRQPTMSGEEYLHSITISRKYVPMVYTYFCRRSMLQQADLAFEPGLIHEDELWTPQMLLQAKSITFGLTPHYAYRRRFSGSITSSTSQARRYDSLLKIVSLLSQAYQRIRSDCSARPFFLMAIRAFFRTCAQMALRATAEEREKFETMINSLTREIQSDDLIQRMTAEYHQILAEQVAPQP